MDTRDAGVVLRKNQQRDLIFRVGGRRYAIPVADVVEVLEHPLPPYQVMGSPPWFAGIVNHHGNVIPVVRMGLFWEVESKGPGNQIILIRESGELIGLAVDQIDSIEQVEVEGPLSGESRRGWLRGKLVEQLDCGVLAAGMRKRARPNQGQEAGFSKS